MLRARRPKTDTTSKARLSDSTDPSNLKTSEWFTVEQIQRPAPGQKPVFFPIGKFRYE